MERLEADIITVRRVATPRRLVALTFDDGPDASFTFQKLTVLASQGVQATFFALGELVDERPDLVGDIVAAGCEVANHSYSHPHLTSLGYAQIFTAIDLAKQAILRAGGGFVPLFRPPYGEFDTRVLGAAGSDGYLYNVLWDVDPLDWQRPSADLITARVVAGVIPGSIVLMHDWVPETVRALPAIISQLRARGYEMVTVSALLGVSPPVPPPPPRPSQCRILQVQTPYLRGDDVFAVQRALAQRGLDPGPVDGVYGPLTSPAVRQFQAQQGLPVTGVVTAEDYSRLGIQCPEIPPPPPPPPPGPSQCRTLTVTSPYMRGDDVLAVQQALLARGINPGPLDGIYGPLTAGAVRAFQAQRGLPVTGVVTATEYRQLGVACP